MTNFRKRKLIEDGNLETSYNKRIQLDNSQLSRNIKRFETGLKPTRSLKLFDMCLEFIATNVEHVDHFRHFPELIGELIFKECARLNKFNSLNYPSETILKSLLLFADGYPRSLIESIDLSVKSKEQILQLESVLSICELRRLIMKNTKLNEITDRDKVNVEVIE